MSKNPYQNVDLEIETGHLYVNLQLALGHAKDAAQAEDIRSTMAALVTSCRYLSEMLLRHPNPIAFLASRGQLNGLQNEEIPLPHVRKGIFSASCDPEILQLCVQGSSSFQDQDHEW